MVTYIPSKFNALTKTEDGGLVVYNSYTGAIVNFEAGEREEVMTALKRQGSTALDTEVKQALFESGFIVKDTVNEMQRADLLHQSMHRTDMLHLILMTTEQCNFRCRYCYESFAKGRMTDETKAGVKALVAERAGTLNDLHISWFGGEPLLELGIIEELSKEYMTIAADNNINYSADVVTNGYFLNRETFEKLLSWNVSQYMVTIDGVQAVHDARRHMIGGQGSFERIVDNLKTLRDVEGDFNMTIRINFDEDNLRETEHLIDFLKEHEDTDLVCLSSLLTTTMPEIKNTIDALTEAGLRDRVKIMIGGAPVTQEYAEEVGADAYTEDAGAAAVKAYELITA